MMLKEKDLLKKNGWIKKDPLPLFERLQYTSLAENYSLLTNDNNISVRNQVFEDMCSGKAKPQSLPDLLASHSTEDDLLLAEFDRYGLPHRTVMNKKTGLVRTDPYYSNEWLIVFYSHYYRDL